MDDPLDAIAVHMGCGIWGLLATAAFAAENMVSNYYGYSPYATDENPELSRPYGFIMGGNGRCVCVCGYVCG